MGIHEHSIKSYYEEVANLPARQKQIYQAIKEMLPRRFVTTDRNIKKYLWLEDMNMVRPRVTELIQKKLIEEADPVICPITKKLVRTVRLAIFVD